MLLKGRGEPPQPLPWIRLCYLAHKTPRWTMQNTDSCLNNDSIVRLDTEQQQQCEGMLTLDECLAALKTFNKNRSPGTDGFTA